MSSLHPLVVNHKIISDQVTKAELSVIVRLAEQRLQAYPGAMVEFGCYVGTTSLFLERLRSVHAPEEKLHVYDSFQGLPEKAQQDNSPVGTQFQEGELLAFKKQLIDNFKKAHLQTPYIHSGWFKGLTARDVPDNISFAFLDGDYYESIIDPLRLIWPKLQKGAIIVIDDYQNEALPGASRAVHDWLKTHKARLRVEASLAVLHTED